MDLIVYIFVTNMALLAAGLFLWLERDNVNPKWKTALSVSGMVCFIAAVHYYYMRGNMDMTDVVAIRYIDWLITVPLQMVEFYIVLAAVTAVSRSSSQTFRFFNFNVSFGYLGETGAVAAINSTTGFVGGMLCWGLMLREIWSGEAAQVNAGSKNAAAHYAFDGMKKIVTFGWAIYPIGYFLGYFTTGGVDMDLTNQVYNLADFVNKILIGMIVYAAAKMDTK